MTVSGPNVIEIKLERLIDDMRLLRSQMIASRGSLLLSRNMTRQWHDFGLKHGRWCHPL
jgi:hypothetical protein